MGFLLDSGFPAIKVKGQVVAFVPHDKIFVKIDQRNTEPDVLRIQKPPKRKSKARNLQTIKRIVVLPTVQCNLACHYCIVRNETAISATQELHSAGLLVETVKGRIETNCWNIVHIFGGEPTLRFEFIRKLHRQISSIRKTHSIAFYVSTNGLYQEEVANFFCKRRITLFISTDGFLPLHNEKRFTGERMNNLLLKNIELQVRNHCPLKLRVTVGEHNITHLVEIAVFFFEMGVKMIHFQPENTISHRQSLDSFFSQYTDAIRAISLVARKFDAKILDATMLHLFGSRESHCLLSGEHEVYAPNGYIGKCYRYPAGFRKYDDAELFRIGTYDEQGVSIDQLKIERVKEAFQSAVRACESCFAKSVCEGGCIAENLNQSGRIDQHDERICESQRYLFDKYLQMLYSYSVEEGHKGR